MEQWHMDAPRMTAREADQLVELWLAGRLGRSSTGRLDTHNLSIAELAFALGTSEEELALMLCQIRSQGTSGRKLRKAIPVNRSWVLIAEIYGAVAVLAL